MRRQEIVSYLSKLYSENKESSSRQVMEKEWVEDCNMYLSKMDAKTFPWEGCANQDLGIIEMTVDNIASRYMMSTIGEQPFFNAIPIDDKGTDKKQFVEDVMTWILVEHVGVLDMLDALTHNIAKFGTSFTKRRWVKDMRRVKKLQMVKGVMTPVDGTDVNEHAAVDIPELEDLFFSPDTGRNIQSNHYIFHRTKKTQDALIRGIQTMGYEQEGVEKCKAYFSKTLKERQKNASQKSDTASMAGSSRNTTSVQMSRATVEVLECYIAYDVDGDMKDEECIFTICPEAQAFLRYRPLVDVYFDGYRPFNRFVYKDVGLLYGRGCAQMLKNYRDSMNTIFNQGVDSATIQMLPWFFFKYASSFKPEEVMLSPGKGIPVDDINDVKIGQFPPTSPLSQAIVTMLMSFVEKQTGLSAPQQGAMSTGKKTAYEIGTVLSEGNIKHENRIMKFHNECSKVFKGIYHLSRNNMPPDVIGRLIDPLGVAKFLQITDRREFMYDYDFMILGSLTMGNKETAKNNTMALYQILMQNPLVAQNPKAVVELTKDVITYFSKKNPGRFLPPDQVIESLYQRSLQMVMAPPQEPPIAKHETAHETEQGTDGTTKVFHSDKVTHEKPTARKR